MKKLLLFDIDGTLITGRGVPKKVAVDTIHKHFPHFNNGHEVPFNGMTDPLIVKDVLAANGHAIEIDDPIVDTILSDFIVELRKHTNRKNPPGVLPGVRTLLDELSNREKACLGLVTGNIMSGAHIKLDAAKIYHYFPVGAFGSDHWNRNMLPPIAMKRAKMYFNHDFSTDNTWIIGDSPKDLECAKANGLKCLAVETGGTSAAEFLNAGADFAIKDFSNTQQVLDIFLS